MAKFTIQLRTIVENGVNIFNFPYEFYDDSKREKFERDFIRHFYFYEIGVETVEKFIFYLEDKMNTVFPYYNELFKSAQVKYELLNNYNLTETQTITRDVDGKSSAISSTVASNSGTQSTTTSGNANTSGNVTETTEGTSTTTGTSTTNTNGNNVEETTNNSETINKNTSNVTGTTSGESEDVKKYLDTPQGAVNLSDSKYLTTLNHDTNNNSSSNNQTTTDNGTSGTDSSGKTTGTSASNTETESQEKTISGSDRTVTNSQESNESSSNSVETEAHVTEDNNTRNYTKTTETQILETKRVGNIGVDTDSDMIRKHIELQRTLKNIETLFFEECADLFMQIF